MKRQSVSQHKLAARAGVSAATVCRVINGHPGVNDDTRRRVQAVIDELGYTPDPKLGRFFKTMNGGIRGVAFAMKPSIYQGIAEGSDPFYARLSMAVQTELSRHDRHMILVNSVTDSLPDGTLNCVAQGLCNGMIGQLEDVEQTTHMARLVPVVLINREADIPKVDSVIPDVDRAARRQVTRLVELGHRHIACFRPSKNRIQPSLSNWQDRHFWNAYQTSCSIHGLPLLPEYLAPIEFGHGETEHAVHQFIDRVFEHSGSAPTAILTYDVYAGELIRQLAARGLRVPQDVSIFGYDDCTHGAPCPLALSTYRQDFATIAEQAVRMLLERLENPDRPAIKVAVEGTIIERESTTTAPRQRQRKRNPPHDRESRSPPIQNTNR